MRLTDSERERAERVKEMFAEGRVGIMSAREKATGRRVVLLVAKYDPEETDSDEILVHPIGELFSEERGVEDFVNPADEVDTH